MGQAIAVRTDYTSGELRRLARRAKDAGKARRLLAIAAVLDGASREVDIRYVVTSLKGSARHLYESVHADRIGPAPVNALSATVVRHHACLALDARPRLQPLGWGQSAYG